MIVANPSMIEAYRAGFPGNGTQVPDGAKIMKIAWKSKPSTEAPFPVDVPDNLLGLGCMVKDSKRFIDSGGGDGARLNMTPRLTRSCRPPWLITRRRRTMPSAGSRAIRS
jgi:predicted transcriptional regulator